MTPTDCPMCSGSAVPVAWGKPSTRTLQAAQQGLLRAGGCIVRGSPDSTWWCPTCESSFAAGPTAAAIESARAAASDRPEAGSR